MHKHPLTPNPATARLDLSRRMPACCRSGAKPVPLAVGLACLCGEMQPQPPQQQPRATNETAFAIAG